MAAPDSRPRDGTGWIWALALFVLAALIGPTFVFRKWFEPEGARSAARADQAYTVRGVVREVAARERRLTIEHEEIPGFMPAMTMPFVVENPDAIQGLAAGDAVEFRFRMRDRAAWIEQIAKVPER